MNGGDRYLLIKKTHTSKNNVLREWLELTDWRDEQEEAEHDDKRERESAISFGYRCNPLSP